MIEDQEVLTILTKPLSEVTIILQGSITLLETTRR